VCWVSKTPIQEGLAMALSEQTAKRGGAYLGLGLAIGAAIGVAFGNVAVGVVVGLLIGAILTAKKWSRPGI